MKEKKETRGKIHLGKCFQTEKKTSIAAQSHKLEWGGKKVRRGERKEGYLSQRGKKRRRHRNVFAQGMVAVKVGDGHL